MTGISPVSGLARSPFSSRTADGCATRGDGCEAGWLCISAAARCAGDAFASRSMGAVATGSLRMSAMGSRLALAAPATSGVWWGRSKASASRASVASAMTAVTLSVLPAFKAIETSCWAHSS